MGRELTLTLTLPLRSVLLFNFYSNSFYSNRERSRERILNINKAKINN